MRWWHGLSVWVLLVATAVPAPAGIFIKRTKPNPQERVPQLIVTVKTDLDESKRGSAAAELRQFDPNAFPEIVPILIDVLKNDPRPSVRLEAAQSLGRLRPVSQPTGMALEDAASHDSNWRVRWQARSSLLHYHLGGYHHKADAPVTGPILDPKTQEPPFKTQEPPLAPGTPLTTSKVIGSTPSSPMPTPDSSPTSPALSGTVIRPMPTGPVQAPTVPVEPPRLQTPPSSGQQGPPF
jgi:hypothetical protein